MRARAEINLPGMPQGQVYDVDPGDLFVKALLAQGLLTPLGGRAPSYYCYDCDPPSPHDDMAALAEHLRDVHGEAGPDRGDSEREHQA